MSGVVVSRRTESKFEAVVYVTELNDMLIELMQRGFGVKNLDHYVRVKFAYGDIKKEDFDHYHWMMVEFKRRMNQTASSLTYNVVAANTIYPTNMHEYEMRRDYQNQAIVNCEQLLHELQRIVDIFDVDINVHERYVKAINREIGLIKNWRRRDNKFKDHLQKAGI